MTSTYDPDSYWQNRGGASYRDYVHSPGYAVYKEEQDDFCRRLVNDVKPERLLDFACGTGKLFPIWRDVPEVHGYDRALSQIEIARAEVSKIRPENPYLLMNVMTDTRTELPYDDDYFDLIVAAEVLLHVMPEDIEAMIGELCRVCRGTLAVITAAPFDNPAAHCFDHDYTRFLSRRFTITDDHAVHRQRYIVGQKLMKQSGPEAGVVGAKEIADAVIAS
jgi:ubiquinone/menaquinone biosynthesis C-methylase UbiE